MGVVKILKKNTERKGRIDRNASKGKGKSVVGS